MLRRSRTWIWLGADGALWLAGTEANTIVRFDPVDSAWAFFGDPPLVEGPFDIKSGVDPSDGFLWFTNKDGNSIGRISAGATL